MNFESKFKLNPFLKVDEIRNFFSKHFPSFKGIQNFPLRFAIKKIFLQFSNLLVKFYSDNVEKTNSNVVKFLFSLENVDQMNQNSNCIKFKL